jgi:hypothetical protein
MREKECRQCGEKTGAERRFCPDCDLANIFGEFAAGRVSKWTAYGFANDLRLAGEATAPQIVRAAAAIGVARGVVEMRLNDLDEWSAWRSA